MTGLPYDIVDVFADRPYGGNPLAAVHGGDALTDGAMQAIAREFHLSETVFTLPPTASDADYRVRIFTPSTELPYAGHPSIGAAWVLARAGVIKHGDVRQQCGAGIVPVHVDDAGARIAGGWPETGESLDAAALAEAVGLRAEDVVGRSGTGAPRPARTPGPPGGGPTAVPAGPPSGTSPSRDVPTTRRRPCAPADRAPRAPSPNPTTGKRTSRMTAHPHNGPVVDIVPFDDDLWFGRARGVTRDLSTGPLTDLDFVYCGSRPEERDGVRLGPEADSARGAA